MKISAIRALLDEYEREKSFKGEHDDLRTKLLKKFIKKIKKEQQFSVEEFIKFCKKRKADLPKLFSPAVVNDNSANSNLFLQLIKPQTVFSSESNQSIIAKLPHEIIFVEVVSHLDDVSIGNLACTSTFFRNGLSLKTSEDYFLKKLIDAGFEKESLLQASIKKYKQFYYTFMHLPHYIRVNKKLCRSIHDSLLYWLNNENIFLKKASNTNNDRKLSLLLLGRDYMDSLHYAMITGPLHKVANELAFRKLESRKIFNFDYLKIAAYTGNYKLLKSLIGPMTNLPPESMTNDFMTLFEYAILSGNMQTVKFLHEIFESRKFQFCKEQKKLILYAIESGNCEIFKYIIEKFPVTIDHQNSQLTFQLHGLQGSYFDHAVNTGNLAMVELVVSFYEKIGISLSDLIASSRINLLNLAAERGSPALMTCLYKSGAPLQTTKTGLTILHCAISSGNIDAMSCAANLLQKNNILLEEYHSNVKSYLQFAVTSKIPAAITFLRKLGLDPLISTKKHPQSAYEMAMAKSFGQYHYPESVREAMTEPLINIYRPSSP